MLRPSLGYTFITGPGPTGRVHRVSHSSQGRVEPGGRPRFFEHGACSRLGEGWLGGQRGEGGGLYPKLALVPVLGERFNSDGSFSGALVDLGLEPLELIHAGLALGVELRERF